MTEQTELQARVVVTRAYSHTVANCFRFTITSQLTRYDIKAQAVREHLWSLHGVTDVTVLPEDQMIYLTIASAPSKYQLQELAADVAAGLGFTPNAFSVSINIS